MIIRKTTVFGEDPRAGAAINMSIDQLLRRQARRNPETLFLVDPPDCLTVSNTAPRQVTYNEADIEVDRLAMALRQIGLRQDDIVAVRMPNTVDAVIALLAIWRAGMIASPIPLPWRRREWTKAMPLIAPKAIITTARIGSEDAAQSAAQIAEKQFSIRFVTAFGHVHTDGVIPVDGLIASAAAQSGSAPDLPAGARPGDHVATLGVMETPEGMVPMPRCHASWLASALRPVADLRLSAADSILCPFMISQTTAMMTVLVPALLSGASIVLHHPFSATTLREQMRANPITVAVLPVGISNDLVESARAKTLHSVIDIVQFGLDTEPGPGPDGLNRFPYAALGDHGVVPMAPTETGRFAFRAGPIRVRADVEDSPSIGTVTIAERADMTDPLRTRDAFGARSRHTLSVTGDFAPDGPWTRDRGGDRKGETANRSRLSLCPLEIEHLVGSLYVATGFSPGYGAIGGLSVDAHALDRSFARVPNAQEAAASLAPDGVTVGIVPEGARPVRFEDVTAFLNELALGEHKHPDAVVPLTALPRTEGGAVDRDAIRARAGTSRTA